MAFVSSATITQKLVAEGQAMIQNSRSGLYKAIRKLSDPTNWKVFVVNGGTAAGTPASGTHWLIFEVNDALALALDDKAFGIPAPAKSAQTGT